MKILYNSTKVERQFSSRYKKKWRYPPMVIEKLVSAENFILQAESLMDVANFTPYRFERLKGKRKNEWSIRLGNTGYRVILIPCDDNGTEIIHGDILAQCKTIKVVLVMEVSNHYE